MTDKPRGCATDGKSHLNLTVTLADAWKANPPRSQPNAGLPYIEVPQGWPMKQGARS